MRSYLIFLNFVEFGSFGYFGDYLLIKYILLGINCDLLSDLSHDPFFIVTIIIIILL